MSLSEEQIARFDTDGFLVVENFITQDVAQAVAARFPKIFRGEFETTVPPDEWRWAEGRDPADVTRMIWNGWKSDRTIAALALDAIAGEYCAKLARWSGTRLSQDGCLWKPHGASGLGFHQDGNYNAWIVPQDLMTCWIALDDVEHESGGIEYVRGSHHWGPGPKPSDFHDPADYRATVKDHARALNKSLEVVPISLKAGGATFHHVWTWHGSGPNTSGRDRRALALHCMPSVARFHPSNPAYAQGRYRKFGDPTMEESFYPVIWQEDGYRSPCIAEHLQASGLEYRSHTFRKAVA